MKSLPQAPKAFLHPRRLPWRMLSLVVILSFLASIGYFAVSPIISFLAGQEGEQTAQLLPEDTEVYLTVNLDPAASQKLKFWDVVDNWWQNPSVRSQWDELTGELESETGINIEEDVLSWLGPELAVGARNLTAEVPEVVVLVGTTMDKDDSVDFFFNMLLPGITPEGEEIPSPEDLGDYNGIGTLVDPDGGLYLGFSDDYIIYCNNSDLFYETLDRILGTETSDSLYDTANFQDARAQLPTERVGMLYCNVQALWDEVLLLPDIPQETLDLMDTISPSIPPYIAGSLHFDDNGVVSTVYCPLPEAMAGMEMPTTNPLDAATIVPSDALAFGSTMDVNATWQEARSALEENWASVGPEIVPGMGLEPDATFAEFMTAIDDMLGFSLDDDVFGWMDGECAFALLPLTFADDEPEVPGILVLFEVTDTSAVQGHLEAIVDGINAMLTDMGEQPLQTSTTDIDGVSATLVTNEAIEESEASPGWLFLEVDTTDYLVLGSTTDALAAAVNAQSDPEQSLSQAEEYQAILSMLPTDKVELGYINIDNIMDIVVSQMNDEERAEFEEIAPFIAPPYALGFASTYVEGSPEVSGIFLSGALCISSAPTAQFWGVGSASAGEAQAVLPEKTVDLSLYNPQVGRIAVSITADILNDVPDADIGVFVYEEASEEVLDGFELAAADADLSILDVAYLIEVGHNLTADDMGTATITMKVGRDWADSYGVENIRIFRFSDGASGVLPTEFIDYEDDYAVFQGTSEEGFSLFGLVAVEEEAALGLAAIAVWVAIAVVVLLVVIGLIRRLMGAKS